MLLVEGGWPAAVAASSSAVGLLVGWLWDGGADAVSAQPGADGA
jgi:hypothetical protein